jgi:hypothetical protein
MNALLSLLSADLPESRSFNSLNFGHSIESFHRLLEEIEAFMYAPDN